MRAVLPTLALSLVLLSAGCDALGPRSGPLNGTWRGPLGIDTYDEFQIEERDDAIGGSYVLGGVFGAPSRYALSGSAHLPQIVLRWDETNGRVYHLVANVTLSPDSQSFSGTLSLDGGPPGPFGPYRRLPQQ